MRYVTPRNQRFATECTSVVTSDQSITPVGNGPDNILNPRGPIHKWVPAPTNIENEERFTAGIQSESRGTDVGSRDKNKVLNVKAYLIRADGT